MALVKSCPAMIILNSHAYISQTFTVCLFVVLVKDELALKTVQLVF